VQNDDQSRRRLKLARHEGEHPEIAGIGAESGGFNEGAAEVWLEVSPIIAKAIDTVQLWQTSQEFDIVGEGHRQLLVREVVSNSI
jgi:hypothetical protein